MDCEICLEEFNEEDRIPKIVVPCGHTVCLHCLLHCERRECPMCRTVFNVPPESLPNNFTLLRLIEHRRAHRGWCSDCRTAAAPACWEGEHDVLPNKRALQRHLQGVLRQAADRLEGLQELCQGEQVVRALTLLTAESCNLTVRCGGRELTGIVRNTEDPVVKAMWLIVAATAALEDRSVARGPPPAARDLPPAARGPSPAARDPPPAAQDLLAAWDWEPLAVEGWDLSAADWNPPAVDGVPSAADWDPPAADWAPPAVEDWDLPAADWDRTVAAWGSLQHAAREPPQ